MGVIKNKSISWFNTRNLAVLCAIVLVALSAGVLLRQTGASNTSAENNSQSRADASSPQTDTKQEAAQNAQTQPQAGQGDKSVASPVYTYTAAPGDSYTALARDALSKYTKAQQISATPAQLLLAEITMANKANSPLLEIGQSVSIPQEAVASAIQDSGVAVEPARTQTSANASSPTPPSPTSQTPPSTPARAANGQYTATAQPGDSYTTIVRKAVKQYVESKKETLNESQLVAAETRITASAGWPAIDIGQAITINQSTLENAVSYAANLDSLAQAAWQPYASNVIFS